MPSCSCRPAALPRRPFQQLPTVPRPAALPWCPGLPAALPLRCPGQQHLPDSSLPQCRHPLRHVTPCHQLCHGSASLQSLCHGAPASNKPHLAEKSTSVWLAICRTWAGFANSQHRDAALATPDNICAHSSLLPH